MPLVTLVAQTVVIRAGHASVAAAYRVDRMGSDGGADESQRAFSIPTLSSRVTRYQQLQSLTQIPEQCIGDSMGVHIEDLSFSYKGTDRLILEHLNIDVQDGEFVCLLGQSGCGKSTLLRLIAGLESPTSGELLFDGEPIHGASLERGIVFQDYGLFPWMSAGKNILLGLTQKFPDVDKADLKKRVYELLEAVGLDAKIYRKLPKELSGGMKQRCAIARAFGIDSPMLLMDEPFGALDAVTRARLQDLVLSLWGKEEEKKTIFFVTHDVDEALLLSTHIYMLGQSPSHVILDERIPEEHRVTRNTQFDDKWILDLRNKLVMEMNRDIACRVE